MKSDRSNFDNFIKEKLKKYGYVESNRFPVNFIFVYESFASYKNKIYANGTEYINLLTGSSFDKITNKLNLYKSLGNKDYLVPTIFIENNVIPSLPRKFLSILKPTNEGAGRGISIVKTKKEVVNWMKDHPKYNNWVLQEYIINPDLFEDRKFHMRNYVILIIKDNKKRLYMSKIGKIITALKPYEKNKFEDDKIHNTHGAGRDIFPTFPENLPDNWDKTDGEKIQEKMELIIKSIFEKENDFKADWRANNGFYMFGIDFMFENKKPYLIEINRKPRLRTDKFLDAYIDVIFNRAQNIFKKLL